MKKAILISLLLVTGIAAQARFCEMNGFVVMEAENANQIKNWVRVDGVSGSAYKDNVGKEGGYLRFEINFTRTGKYYAWFLNMAIPPEGVHYTDANDCYVTLDGKEMISSVDNKTSILGMRTGCTSMCWTSAPKVHDDEAHLRNKPVYLNVTSIGTKTLEIKSRGKGYVVDKISLQLNDSSKPVRWGYSQTLCSTGITKPSFTVQPEPQLVKAGRTATFEAEVSGAPVISYQWQKDGVDIPGATDFRYRLSGVQAFMGGSEFTCKAANSVGSAVSRSAGLIVYDPANGIGEEIEAETMQLSGYTLDNTLNNQVVTLPVGTASGTAKYTFSGSEGKYYVAVSIVPENDGQPELAIKAGSTTLRTITYPEDPFYANMSWRLQYLTEPVNLNSGDIITLEGTADRTAYARVDKLIIVPENPSAISDVPVFHAPAMRDAGISGALFDLRGRPVSAAFNATPGVYLLRTETQVTRVVITR